VHEVFRILEMHIGNIYSGNNQSHILELACWYVNKAQQLARLAWWLKATELCDDQVHLRRLDEPGVGLTYEVIGRFTTGRETNKAVQVRDRSPRATYPSQG
jgi:hypothetical protein